MLGLDNVTFPELTITGLVPGSRGALDFLPEEGGWSVLTLYSLRRIKTFSKSRHKINVRLFLQS